MSIIADLEVVDAFEMRNTLFARKATYNAYSQMLSSVNFVLYGFQANPITGTTVSNDTGVAAWNMTLSDVAMWNLNGWYVNTAPKCYGRGLIGVGGASALRATIPHGAMTTMAGAQNLSISLKVLLTGAGGGGSGRIFEKENSIRLRHTGAQTLVWEVYDTILGWVGVTHGGFAALPLNQWLDISLVFDGTLVGDVNRMKFYVGGRDVTTVATPGVPAALVDAVAGPIYLLNSPTFNNAEDGRLGCFFLDTSYALSMTQIRSLIEYRGVYQPTAPLYPAVHVPGVFGPQSHLYVSATGPDLLVSYQLGLMGDVRTGDFTWIFWGAPVGGFAGLRPLCALEAVSPALYIRATAAQLSVKIVAAETAFGGLATQNLAPFCAGMVRRAGNLYGYLNGIESTNAVAMAGDITSAAFMVGADDLVPTNSYDGAIQHGDLFDRGLTRAEMERVARAGYSRSGPRWLPDR